MHQVYIRSIDPNQTEVTVAALKFGEKPQFEVKEHMECGHVRTYKITQEEAKRFLPPLKAFCAQCAKAERGNARRSSG